MPKSFSSVALPEHTKTAYGRHAILLFHGFRSSPGELLPVVGPLRALGYEVSTPQYRGYSDARNAPFVGRWQDWLEDALHSFDALSREYESVSLGGLCSGAVLALAVAQERSSAVRALALLSPTLFYDGWGLSWLVRLRYLGYYTPLRYFWTIPERPPYGVKNPQIRAWITRQMTERNTSVAGAARLPLAGVYQVEQLIRHVKPRLAHIIAPALLLHAREDEVTSLRSPHYLIQHLGSSDKRLVLLEDSYHMITLDNERRQVIAEITQFLRQHTPLHDVVRDIRSRTALS